MKRAIVTIVLAINFIEWLEFSLYLYMAKSIFADVFFPPSSHSLSLTFAIFAAAYLARPVGGWLFGKAADLHGRKKPMILTAGLMGSATLGLCLLPGYEHIGILSTWLLLCFRILQGLALGGEINTSAMFIIEHHTHKPLVVGSLVAAFGALGMFMGGALAAIIQTSSNPHLWRYLFAAVGILSLGICRLRKKLLESPEFTSNQPMSLKQIFANYWRKIINISAVAVFVSTTVYTQSTSKC